ncbi:MAG TPA: stage V sporulation protein AC [Acholeplasmataceae bacterium]|jgi:stage V sporulation protein AC|nr:stage V sporulation protein AC [Acholeplasmataceae bacterium]
MNNDMKAAIESAKQATKPKRKVLLNTVKAFFVGGTICLIAQVIIDILKKQFDLDKEMAGNIGVAIMVFLGSLLTGIGVYDKIGQFAGAGTIIPITGFANSMTSAALESKSEGIVLGIFTNMFKMAGSVIVVGVISAFVFGTIRYLLGI